MWQAVAVRRSDGQTIVAKFYDRDTPSRERCAREMLVLLNEQGVASPSTIRGFGDIALLRVYGYEFLSVERLSDGDYPYGNAPPASGANPPAITRQRVY
jgi:hypothetical protein